MSKTLNKMALWIMILYIGWTKLLRLLYNLLFNSNINLAHKVANVMKSKKHEVKCSVTTCNT